MLLQLLITLLSISSLSCNCQMPEYNSTDEIPVPPIVPSAFWNIQQMKVSENSDFHPETNSIHLPVPILGCPAWWDPSQTANSFAGVGISFTSAILDEISMEILHESALTDLVYKSYSYLGSEGSFKFPFLNVGNTTNDSSANGYVAYMINLNNKQQWKRIGRALASNLTKSNDWSGSGVKGVKVKSGNWNGAPQISFIVTEWKFDANPGEIINVPTTTTTTTTTPTFDCVWYDKSENILNLTSLKGKTLTMIDSNDASLVYALSQCDNLLTCGEINVMSYLWDIPHSDCKQYFAKWEDGIVEPNYNSVDKRWQFVYSNGETCDGLEQIFEVFWNCDPSRQNDATDIVSVARDDNEFECVYVMQINSSIACN